MKTLSTASSFSLGKKAAPISCLLIGVLIATSASSSTAAAVLRSDNNGATNSVSTPWRRLDNAPDRPEYCASYLQQGDWAKPECGTCKGVRQSPVDIPVAADLATCSESPALKVNYPAGGITGELETFGGDVYIGFSNISGASVTFQYEEYALLQTHWHSLGEHELEGNSFPLEMHFVHKSKSNPNKLLVIGQWVEVSFNLKEMNPTVSRIAKAARKSLALSKKVPVRLTNLELSKAIDLSKGFYNYDGSLTTAPCSEIVTWIVTAQPVKASIEDIQTQQSAKIFEAKQQKRPFEVYNNRKVQALGSRKVRTFCGNQVTSSTS